MIMARFGCFDEGVWSSKFLGMSGVRQRRCIAIYFPPLMSLYYLHHYEPERISLSFQPYSTRWCRDNDEIEHTV